MDMTEKLKSAALDAAIENADELFNGGDKAQLSLAAGMVGASLKELFADTVKAVMHVTLEAASKTDSGVDGFNDSFMELLGKSDDVDKFVTALHFLGRFANDAALTAVNNIGEETSVARFGRN